MIGVAALPVGKNHHARPLLANDAGDLDSVGVGILDTPVRNIERLAPRDLQNASSIGGFPGAAFRRAARAQFSLRQIKNAGARTFLSHFQERAAAGLLHIVAVRGNGENVEWRRTHFLRSTRNAAISRRSLALSPKRSSARLAFVTSSSAFSMEASIPKID